MYIAPFQCVVPGNVHTHAREGHWKIQAGWGGWGKKPNFFKGKCDFSLTVTDCNFQRGRGKTFCDDVHCMDIVRSNDIFTVLPNEYYFYSFNNVVSFRSWMVMFII